MWEISTFSGCDNISKQKGDSMKSLISLVAVSLLAVAAFSQDKKADPPKSASAPSITAEDKLKITQLENKVLRENLEISQLQTEYTKVQQQNQADGLELQSLIASASKGCSDGKTLSTDTWECVDAPKAPAAQK
jgi:hypothetical protein